MRIVRVTWLDALTIAEWTKVDAAVSPQVCVTVGHVVSEADDHVTIAATVSADEYNAAQQIPRSMIQSIVEIIEAAP